MKICPMCGSDVLGAEAGAKCTSCGANLDETPHAATETTPEAKTTDTGNPPPRELDDSAPIMKSDDLELVQSGHAFWTEPRAQDKEDTDPAGRSTEAANRPADARPEPAGAAQEPEASPKPSTIFTAPAPNADAPSLAELARRRKAQLLEASFAADATGNSEIRHDHVTSPPPASEDTAAAKAVPAVTAEKKITEDPDDTQPSGIKASPDAVVRQIDLDAPAQKTDPSLTAPKVDAAVAVAKADPAAAVQTPAAAVTSVAKSPDIAFIDGNKLSIPGARWSTGDKVVVSGRTYELRRKISKYPVTPREMLIGTGTFLFGLIVALMVAAGGGTPNSVVYGVVREAQSGRLLPGVTVAVEGTNQTVQSDPSGLFYMNGLKGGIYSMVASDPIYGSARQAVTVADGATSVTIDLAKPEMAEVPPLKPTPKRQPQRPANNGTVEKESVAEVETSELAVEAPISNARVFLDGKLLGVGNARYSEIKPGKHSVEVTHDGFEPWKRTMTFAAGEVTRLKPDLKPVRDPEPVQQSADEYAAQGRKNIEARNWQAALGQFDQALKQEQRAQFYAWRAEAYVGLKDLNHAETDFLQAIYLFRKSGEAKRLDGLLERAVLVVPASAPLWQARGDYLYSQRKLSDAEKCYRRALELGGDQVAIYTAIGLTQYAGGSFEMAYQSWTLADEASGLADAHLAGYLALAAARLQYRASCRDYVRRLEAYPDVLTQFRAHPDWDKVQHLAGQG